MDRQEALEIYKAYEDYARTLRAWFIAYGIGGPVLILSNDRFWAALVASGGLASVGILFLAGVGLQVLLAALNKAANWGNYYALIQNLPEDGVPAHLRACAWVSRQFWMDLLVDVATLVLFGFATILAFRFVLAMG